MTVVRDPYQAAASAYFTYGIVYLIGGLYLLSRGVGVVGARTDGNVGDAMLRWGLIGLIPLIVIPFLLRRPWSWLGGWASRRTFAWLVAILLTIRVYKVGQIALHGGGAVSVPWGGTISFQLGAAIFLVVTLMALIAVVRAALGSQARRA